MKNSDWQTIENPSHPMPDARWVRALVRIQRVSDGETRELLMDQVLNNGSDIPNTNIWTDGNFSCDCNRELFFEEARGHAVPDEVLECSDGRFLVELCHPETREIYYTEFTRRA